MAQSVISGDHLKKSIGRTRAPFVVLPVVLLVVLLFVDPAQAVSTPVHITIFNTSSQPVTFRVTEYDSYYESYTHSHTTIQPMQADTLVFHPTAWFLYRNIYKYTITADGRESVTLQLKNWWHEVLEWKVTDWHSNFGVIHYVEDSGTSAMATVTYAP